MDDEGKAILDEMAMIIAMLAVSMDRGPRLMAALQLCFPTSSATGSSRSVAADLVRAAILQVAADRGLLALLLQESQGTA